jgi:hypothetical protein
VQGGYGTCFCRPGTNFIEHYACRAESPDMRSIVRSTSLIGAANLSQVTNLVVALAQCRAEGPYRSEASVMGYKLSRSQKSVTIHDFNWGQMSVSGCKNHYEFYLGSRSKSKNRDNLSRDLGKQLTHIVRVSNRLDFIDQLKQELISIKITSI